MWCPTPFDNFALTWSACWTTKAAHSAMTRSRTTCVELPEVFVLCDDIVAVTHVLGLHTTPRNRPSPVCVMMLIRSAMPHYLAGSHLNTDLTSIPYTQFLQKYTLLHTATQRQMLAGGKYVIEFYCILIHICCDHMMIGICCALILLLVAYNTDLKSNKAHR